VQLESGGWQQASERQDILGLLCRQGLQPYAIRPDIESTVINKETYERYFVPGESVDHEEPVKEETCRKLASQRFTKSCPEERTCEEHLLEPWQLTTFFSLEPLCVCDTRLNVNGTLLAHSNASLPLAALCAYQIAAVQTKSPAFLAVKARFGGCNGYPAMS